jgi:hypothetical protein
VIWARQLPFCTFAQPVSESHESAVQAFPSSQLTGAVVQPDSGSQLSTVQALLSSQLWTAY